MRAKRAVAALLAAAAASGPAERLSPREMKAVEAIEPVEFTGRFLYLDHVFETNSPPVFICQLDTFRTGGSFLPLRFDGGEAAVCGDGIDCCHFMEWYRVRRTDGSVDLAVLSDAGYRDGDDDDRWGFHRPRPVSVFRLDGKTVRRTILSGSFADLLLEPGFASIEPAADWCFAQRRDDGTWSDDNTRWYMQAFLDEDPPPGDPAGMPAEADGTRLAALRKTLLDRFGSGIPQTIRFVFERNGENDIVRAFVADSAKPLPGGEFLWEAFQWTEREWESVPPEGAKCPSGKVPASFRLPPSGFFVLSYENDKPRIVALGNSPDGPVETFWETALPDREIVAKIRHLGIPDREDIPYAWDGVSMPPRSIAQSLYNLGTLRRLERIFPVGLDVVAPLWEP